MLIKMNSTKLKIKQSKYQKKNTFKGCRLSCTLYMFQRHEAHSEDTKHESVRDVQHDNQDTMNSVISSRVLGQGC